MTTRIPDLKLVKVVDGDTVKVELGGKTESLRLLCLDTEESLAGSSKPVTTAGKQASAWAKQFFGADAAGFVAEDVRVDVEFDTLEPTADAALKRHRGNYGRLLCYVHMGAKNFNLEAVKAGHSPYFVKYGRSRAHHEAFLRAEAEAQSLRLGIWDERVNAGGPSRDYERLLPWWAMRDGIVEEYRREGAAKGALSVRLDYEHIVAAASGGSSITIFCDLQGGVDKWPGDGAVIFAGSRFHKFNLWVPERESPAGQRIIELVERRYAGAGRGYVYVTGKAKMYPPSGDRQRPEIELVDPNQLADAFPAV